MVEQIIAIFCDIDDFSVEYEKYCSTHLLMSKEQTIPKTSMSISEIMTITVMFHLSNYRTFKWYYLKYVSVHLREYFPKLVSYNRFVEIMQTVMAPLTLYLMKHRFGKCSGINFMDSTSLDVCDNHRIHSHKVFEGLAKRGKSSTGWLHELRS